MHLDQLLWQDVVLQVFLDSVLFLLIDQSEVSQFWHFVVGVAAFFKQWADAV